MFKLYLKLFLYTKVYIAIIFSVIFIFSYLFKEKPQYVHDVTIKVKYTNGFVYTFNIIDTNYNESLIPVKYNKNRMGLTYIKYGNTVIGYNIDASKTLNYNITKIK